jgi:hypothetical protein
MDYAPAFLNWNYSVKDSSSKYIHMATLIDYSRQDIDNRICAGNEDSWTFMLVAIEDFIDMVGHKIGFGGHLRIISQWPFRRVSEYNYLINDEENIFDALDNDEAMGDDNYGEVFIKPQKEVEAWLQQKIEEGNWRGSPVLTLKSNNVELIITIFRYDS